MSTVCPDQSGAMVAVSGADGVFSATGLGCIGTRCRLEFVAPGRSVVALPIQHHCVGSAALCDDSCSHLDVKVTLDDLPTVLRRPALSDPPPSPNVGAKAPSSTQIEETPSPAIDAKPSTPLDRARMWLAEHGHPVPVEQAQDLVALLQPTANAIVAAWRKKDVDELKGIVDDATHDEVMRASAAVALMTLNKSFEGLFMDRYPRDATTAYALAAVHNRVFERACGGSEYPCGNKEDEALIRLAESGDRRAVSLVIAHLFSADPVEVQEWVFLDRNGPAQRIRARQPKLLFEEVAKQPQRADEALRTVFSCDCCGSPSTETLAEAKALDALGLEGASARLRDATTARMRAFNGGEPSCDDQ